MRPFFKLRFRASKRKEREPLKDQFVWTYDGRSATAHTKSEARAMFAKAIGVDRLPPGAVIEKVVAVKQYRDDETPPRAITVADIDKATA